MASDVSLLLNFGRSWNHNWGDELVWEGERCSWRECARKMGVGCVWSLDVRASAALNFAKKCAEKFIEPPPLI